MATYQFETITAEQALAIQSTDLIVANGGTPPSHPSVAYVAATATTPETIQVTIDGRTVAFGTQLQQLSMDGGFTRFGSQVHIGTSAAETLVATDTNMIFGAGGDDHLRGSAVFGDAGNDTLDGGGMYGGEGDDLMLTDGYRDFIDGGAGFDTIVLPGVRDDYFIMAQSGGFTAYYLPSGDDSDYVTTYTNVERLRFDDGDYSASNRLSIFTDATHVSEGGPGETRAHYYYANRTGDTSGSLTVAWHATSESGADFQTGSSAHGQLTFAPGQTSVELIVYTVGDNEAEADENFDVTLDGGYGWLFVGGPGWGHVSADDPGEYPILTVVADTRSVAEGNSGSTPVTFTVTRSGLTTNAVEATYVVHGTGFGGATASDFVGGEYPTGLVSFAAGETTKTITINVVGDTLFEGGERFRVVLINPTGNAAYREDGTNSNYASINNDDTMDSAVSIAANQASRVEGDAGASAFTFTLTRSGYTAQSISVDYNVAGSGDHAANLSDFQGGALPSGTVNFAAGETSKTITINVSGDSSVESDEAFTVTLSNPTGLGVTIGTASATGTIVNDDTAPPSGGGSSGGGTTTPPPSQAPDEPRLIGDAGPDTIQGTAGADTISGGNGVSYLRGGEGADIVIGGADFDDINGNQGDDTASGGDGADWVVGGKDNDFLTGDNGDDIVYGNLGDDVCEGGDGKDLVRGGQGNDVVKGGVGDDWLSGDRGDDTVTGGTGADIFHSFGEAGVDRVLDFSRAEGDRVQLDPGTVYTVAQVGADTVIDMQGGGQVILVGVAQSSLSGDWIFGA